jgi:uncharacterized membrane protein
MMEQGYKYDGRWDGGGSMHRNHENTEERVNRILSTYEDQISTRINQDYVRHTKKSDRIADKIAEFGGSWRFIIIFSSFLAVWMVWNTLSWTTRSHFDPAPFILLNLILSFTAAFQAPIIMMSQNRQAARDKQESMIDFAINYKAEQEIDDIQGHLHRGEAAAELLVRNQKHFQDQLNELRAENETLKQILLARMDELKQLVEKTS